MFQHRLEIQKVFSSKKDKEEKEAKKESCEIVHFFIQAKTEEEIQKIERWLLR